MKRLNRKGFTLVELLAVIVILAIVVGITLVTVLPTLKRSRQAAFDLTAQTAADFLEKQNELTLVGDVSGDTLVMNSIPTTETSMTSDDFKMAGLKPENYVIGTNGSGSTWYINSATDRACVKLIAMTRTNAGEDGTAGEYYDVETDVAKSTGCN